MQKWEYSFVFATVTNDGEFRPRFANDEELDDWQTGPTLYEYANQLGSVAGNYWPAIQSSSSNPNGNHCLKPNLLHQNCAPSRWFSNDRKKVTVILFPSRVFPIAKCRL